MATLLDDRLVTDALANLDGWTGDAQRLRATVEVDDADALLAAVAEAADALDHHPKVERDGAAVTFELWTHSKGGVTELDIALATRINDLVHAQRQQKRTVDGEVRSVAGATTEAGAVAGRTVTAEPQVDAGGQTTPSRPEESATGREPYPTGTQSGAAGTFHEAAAPRSGAGAAPALPDPEPGSIEPQPGNAPTPGLHEDEAGPQE